MSAVPVALGRESDKREVDKRGVSTHENNSRSTSRDTLPMRASSPVIVLGHAVTAHWVARRCRFRDLSAGRFNGH